MDNFANKVAVVTGAGSGMGRYIAVLLAKMGCNVAICDVNEETLADTHAMLRHYNVATSRHIVDIGDKGAIDEFYETVINQHEHVDLVFNNAGITIMSEFADMPENDWDRVMDVNFHGVINMTRKFLPHLQSRPDAALVNTSSIFGMVAVPTQSVYHATKFAVRGFTESLVKEMRGSKLQVHCVHPGHVGTNIAASAKQIESNDAGDKKPAFFGRDISWEQQGELFRDNGMHPSRAAEIILNGVRKKKSRIFVGWDAKLIDLAQRLLPRHYDKLFPLIFIPMLLVNRVLKKPLTELPQEPRKPQSKP